MRFDLDLKVAGREDEIVEMLRERSLVERAMVSTMEIRSIELPARARAEAAARLDAAAGRSRLELRRWAGPW